MRPYHFGFIIEQALGHITHGKNLQINVPKDPEVAAHWSLPAWETTGLAGKIPLFNSNWTVRAGLRARRAVRAMLRQQAMDALFFHTQITAVLSPDLVRRVPSIVSLDATPRQFDAMGDVYTHQTGPAWLERWKWRLNRDCFHAARVLVTWSNWTKQGLVAEYEVPPDKVTVIAPGVNTAEWTRPTPRRLQNEVVKILFVGGNLERKGGLLLLAAFRALRQEARQPGNEAWPELELHLVTRDRVPAETGLFVYNDLQPNAPALKQLYYDCDIFCLPTYGDMMPIVLSEAGAAGMVAVATTIAAIPEVVRDGENGFLVPPGDSEALTAVLRRLISDPELRLCQGERAIEVVCRDFDAEKNAFRLLNLMKEIVPANGRPRREK
jgi:glycosyltransferase involved in cell wall biosynthesis